MVESKSLVLDAFKYTILNELPTSTAKDREEWAKTIVSEKWLILDFAEILFSERRQALAFSWLLSDIGLHSKQYLFDAVPSLFELRHEVSSFPFEQAFATYWLIAGIPTGHKGEAVDLLFTWIRSSAINITTKTRALKALLPLTLEHPELKTELILTLENHLVSETNSFTKKARKVLENLP